MLELENLAHNSRTANSNYEFHVRGGESVRLIGRQWQLCLQMKDGLLFLVPIPSVEFADFGKPVIKAIGPVVVGTDEVIFQGEGLADLQKVVFNGIELKLRKQADGKHVWVKGLRASGATAESKAQTLDFYFKSGKTPVTLTVSAPKPS